MTNELTDVRCPCGTEFPAESYDAGFIAGSGMCQNCDAALPPKDICTCPSGDGSLRHPCPAHPAVEQAGGDERVIGWRERILAAHPNSDPGFWPDALLVEHMAAEIADLRAALAQPSQAPTEGFTHFPELLESVQQMDAMLKANSAQAEAERPVVIARLYRSNDLTMTPFAEVQKPLPMPRSDGTLTVEPLMTVAQHERIVGALRAEIAEWQEAAGRGRSDVVAYIAERAKLLEGRDAALARVAELTATRNRYGVDAHYFNKNLQRILRDFESFTPDELARSLIILAKVADEKVVAQHSVLEKQEPVATVAKVPGEDWNGLHFYRDLQGIPSGTKLYTAPVAQAQHSVPEGFREKFKQCMELAFAEIAFYVSPEKARNPNSRARKASALATELLDMLAAAPGNEGV
ncbi:hypothetical protein [Pseudomonas aeruginosa]|uniref:hypothetical protein n=1 Tax=Pseudomonas aeruginosa TaxID=287 RepID=UPI00187332DA|nr:hypothetical protein [Pseudomonas aeruginosa]